MADNKGYDVISDTATSAVAAAVIPKVDVGDVMGGMDDFGIGSELWTYLCSQHRVSDISGHIDSDNFSSLHPVQIERHADHKLHTSDNFRFIVDVYVVGVICFIGFVGKSLLANVRAVNKFRR